MSVGTRPKGRAQERSARRAGVDKPSLPPGLVRPIVLVASHKPVREYYAALEKFEALGQRHEGAVRDAFSTLLKHCARQLHWTLVGEYRYERGERRPAKLDGALIDDKWKLLRAAWEAKDSDDDLDREIQKKVAVGYPTENILFQEPKRAVLYQNGRRAGTYDLKDPEALVDALKALFNYRPPPVADWEAAAEAFGERVPQASDALMKILSDERRDNAAFAASFAQFLEVCKTAINPNIAEDAVEKMLVQHLLTERIFRKVFNNADFIRRNVIAVEIEKVIDALTSQSFNRDHFLSNLDPFYRTLERAAASIDEYERKQSFLNRVYERFFQGFDERAADKYGIVYTPQPIVAFMTRSVDALLKQEFGKSLGDDGVHLIDPFVGTGNFILYVMRAMPKTRLTAKYRAEMHANEILLLPYYVSAMNIEHRFAEITGKYEPFEGLCLVDTFETSESPELRLAFMSEANSRRVERQKRSPIFVILGNPPYNAWQANDSDRSKNRKYRHMDKRVGDTYGADSKAKLISALKDPYVKAFRWASDRLGKEGILAYVSNSSFLDGLPFDGMRKHLKEDFDALYILDLGGNVRRNPKLSGTVHSVFGIQVGVCVTFAVRRAQREPGGARIFYARFNEEETRERKFEAMDTFADVTGVTWKEIRPDADHTWLQIGNEAKYARFLPMSPKGVPNPGVEGCIFASCSNGPKSQRDSMVWDFDRSRLLARMKKAVNAYNGEMARHAEEARHGPVDLDQFLDRTHVKWSDTLKMKFERGIRARFSEDHARRALWRPYTRQFLYLDELWVDRPGQVMHMLPTAKAESENIGIVTVCHSQVPFAVFASNTPVCIDVGGRPAHFFPFYLYDEDGSQRRENITDWALEQFRDEYSDESITKWEVFCYIYGLLHHPEYQNRYQANLKRALPRIPFVPDFRVFAEAGKKLLKLHVEFEKQPEYRLVHREKDGAPLDWRVQKMRLSRDGDAVIYNEFLTLEGVPGEAFDYRVGGRSALEWVIDQFQETTDARTGITNDPNRSSEPDYIVRLVKRVVHLSVESAKIIRSLPRLPRLTSPPAKTGSFDIPAPAMLDVADSGRRTSSRPPPKS